MKPRTTATLPVIPVEAPRMPPPLHKDTNLNLSRTGYKLEASIKQTWSPLDTPAPCDLAPPCGQWTSIICRNSPVNFYLL